MCDFQRFYLRRGESRRGEVRRGEFYLRRGEVSFRFYLAWQHYPPPVSYRHHGWADTYSCGSPIKIAQWTQYILWEFKRRIDKRESITNLWQKSYNWYLYHEFIELVHQLPMNISFGQTKQNSTTKKKKIGNIKYNNKRYTFLFFFFQLFSIFFFICIYIYILYIYLLFLYL